MTRPHSSLQLNFFYEHSNMSYTAASADGGVWTCTLGRVWMAIGKSEARVCCGLA